MPHLPLLLVLAATCALLVTVAVWSWRQDRSSFVGRLLLLGLVSCTTWAIGLGLFVMLGPSFVACLLWLPSATATSAAIFVLSKVANSSAWRPSRRLIGLLVGEAVAIFLLCLTNEHHGFVAKDLQGTHFQFSWAFGLHTLLCFVMLGSSALEMSRRTSDASRWMRGFAATVMVSVIAMFTAQVLQIPASQTFAAIAVSSAALAVHRGGLGQRGSDLYAGFDPTDLVTGVLSRRALESVLTGLSAAPTGPHHVLVIDVDRFKGVNDAFGHLGGDQVLAQIAARMAEAAPDLELGRFGGDEFVGVLRNTSAVGAEAVADRVAQAVSSTPIILTDGRSVAVSVTIGTAACLETDWQTWVADADAAMYRRKRLDGDDPLARTP